MANTRHITTSQGQNLGEMNMMNQELVTDRIEDLMREGEALRAERFEADHRSLASRPVPTRAGPLRPARIRLGRWLVGVGWAVAGCPDESHSPAGHAV